MNIQIRHLKKQDIVKAAEIFRTAFNSVGEKWSTPTAVKRLEQYYSPKTCWVAEIDSQIVGLLTAKVDNVWDHQELYIDIIAVDPMQHKSGIGSKLLQTAEDYAKSHELKAVWLTSSSKIPSFNWYLKIGFRETSWKVLVKEL